MIKLQVKDSSLPMRLVAVMRRRMLVQRKTTSWRVTATTCLSRSHTRQQRKVKKAIMTKKKTIMVVVRRSYPMAET